MSPFADPGSGARGLPPGRPETGFLDAGPRATLAEAQLPRVGAYAAEEEAHFWDYWRVVVRHRWTVLTTFLVAMIAGTVWTYTRPPLFTASVTLRIEKEEPKIVKYEEVVKADPQEDYYQTQYRLLRSRTLANRVIGLLQLDQHPDFQDAGAEPGWTSRLNAWVRAQMVLWIPVPPPPVPENADDLIRPSPVTDAFLRRLSVEPERNTRLVRVSFTSRHPDLAARVPNSLAEAFVSYNLDHKLEASRYAIRFLTGQIEEARRKLEESDAKLTRLLSGSDIFLNPDKAGEYLDLALKDLLLLSDALLKVRAERIGKEGLVAQALSQNVDSVPSILENPHVAKLKQELMSLEAEYRKLGQTFKPDYPRMQRLQYAIGEVHRQLRSEMGLVVEGLESDLKAAQRKEEALEKQVAELRAVVRRSGNQMTQYSFLRRDADMNREHYSSLLGRLKEIGVSSALLTSNISVVDRAELPLVPGEPRPRRDLFYAALIGLFGGVGLAFFFEYLDTTVKDAKEVETVLRVPALGLIPSKSANGGRARRLWQLAEGDDEITPFGLVAHQELASPVAEALRNLRTALLYSAPDHPPKTFMVTSPQTEDGKTSLAANLAITLSQLGVGEILLVDADMRRPNLHTLFDVPRAPGLSTFLTGQAELSAALKATAISNLYVIPAGRTPTNPTELLTSARLARGLDLLHERFAHIVFDTTPLFGVSDALILAARVEGVVLVLRHGRASREAARRAIQLLASVRARLLGVVLNDVTVQRGAPGYYGYYGYYGDGAASGTES